MVCPAAITAATRGISSSLLRSWQPPRDVCRRRWPPLLLSGLFACHVRPVCMPRSRTVTSTKRSCHMPRMKVMSHAFTIEQPGSASRRLAHTGCTCTHMALPEGGWKPTGDSQIECCQTPLPMSSDLSVLRGHHHHAAVDPTTPGALRQGGEALLRIPCS